MNEQKRKQDKRERRLKRKAFKLWCYQQELKETNKSASPQHDQQDPEENPETAPPRSTTESVSTKKGKSIPGRKTPKKKSLPQEDVLNAALATAAMIQRTKQAEAKSSLVQQTDGAYSMDESYQPSESSDTESSKCGSTSSEDEFLSANSSVEKMLMFKKAKFAKKNKEPKPCSSKNISFDADRDSYLKAKEAYLQLKRKRKQFNYSEDVNQQEVNSSAPQLAHGGISQQHVNSSVDQSARQSVSQNYGDEKNVSFVTSFELEVDSHPSDQVKCAPIKLR